MESSPDRSWRSSRRPPAKAAERLMPWFTPACAGLASQLQQRRNHLQPTALVHEAYLRLVGQRSVSWANRAHFFGIASRMMRRILVDHARKRRRDKRSPGTVYLDLGTAEAGAADRAPELLALDDALTELEKLDARQARVVELRFFAGLSVEETAEVTGISTATVKREWKTARAFLRHEIGLEATP
jgi:RNA polymerase sigma factor (TIGR02999 family)